MRKTIYLFAAALLALASCQEWEPVFTLSYGDVEAAAPQSLQVTATIAQLKDLYEKHGALKIEDDNMVIAGKVISDDHSGNIYRELYIKDDTGVYVRCGGLTIGQYNGMPQLGVEDPTGEYETAYLDSRYLIDAHVVKGAQGEPVQPRIVTEAELNEALQVGYTHEIWGQLVTIADLQYGAKGSYASDHFKRIFILLYVDPFKDKKASTNRVFCSSETYGVTTWAMSKNKFLEYLDAGCFDKCGTSDKGMNDVFDELSGLTVKESIRANASAVTTSQYFHLPKGLPVQIRTSGFAKFADTEIDPAILGNPDAQDGALCTATGIVTVYNGAVQLALVDGDSVKVQ